MSKYAKILSLSYNSAEAVKESALKTYWRSVRLIKNPDTINPGKESYVTNILLCGNCIDYETRKLYLFYIDTFYGAAWIIEVGVDDRVQKVVYYDRNNDIGFNPLYKIYNARVVNGRIIWTDNNKPIYQIDIERAKASYYFGIGYNSYAVTEWNEYSYYAPTQIVSYGKYFYRALVGNANELPVDDETIWNRLCSIEDAYYSMNIENFYFAPAPPKYPPTIKYVSDPNRNINNLKQTLFQFAYRYIYMDWRKSTFSPASLVQLPQAEEETSTGLANEMISLNNSFSIEVNLGGEEVRAVEVIARSSDDPATWFLIDTIEKFEDQEKGGIKSKITNASSVDLTISVNDPIVTNVNAPLAPVAVPGTDLTSTSFKANWEVSIGAIGYLLDVSTDPAFATYISNFHNRDVGNVLTFSVTGIQSNATYYYRVRAYKTSELVSYNSNVITVVIVLDAPVALEATDVFETGLTANWQARAGATGYYLDVSLSGVFATFVAGWNNKNVGNVLSDDVTGLTINTTYYYRVRAYNTLGTSANSNRIDQRTEAPPTDPVALAASLITETTFTANWEASTGIGSGGYELDVATDIAFVNKVEGYDNRPVGDVLLYIVRGLTQNTTYYYRIKAINAHQVASAYSNIITTLTLLSPPVAVSATDTFETGFSANWEVVTGATGYRLDVSLVNTFATFVAGYNNKDVGNVLTYDVTGLTVNTSYFYRVRAYTVSQTSVSSNTISQRTQVPPDAPIALPATNIHQTYFTANWEVGGDATNSGYIIDVATDSDFLNILTGYDNRNVGNVTSFVIRLLTANTPYYYRIMAYNAHGIQSVYSNIITTVTLLPAPIALEATNVGEIGFTANWEIVTGATGYRLDVAIDNLFASLVSGYDNKDVGSVVSSIVTGLSVNTAYFYRVRAYTSTQVSANSNIIDQRTQAPPANPVAIAATGINPTTFYANWQGVAGSDYSGYYLDVSIDAGFAVKVTGYNGRDVGNVLTYMVRGLIPSTPYWYRVRAYNAHGVLSGWSNTITVTTAVQLVPSPPVATGATGVLPTGITANWNAALLATGYRLDVSRSSVFATFVEGYNNLDVGNVVTFNITGLTSGYTYYYRVRAYNTYGTSVASNVITQDTGAYPATILSINPQNWNFGGAGASFKKAILVTTNGTGWSIEWPSTSEYIHVYQYLSDNEIELYYDGPFSTGDTVVFTATGPGGSASVTFSGYWV